MRHRLFTLLGARSLPALAGARMAAAADPQFEEVSTRTRRSCPGDEAVGGLDVHPHAHPVLPAAFLRALGHQAGVHIYTNRDDTLCASRSYRCLNADGAGGRTLRFPLPTNLFNPFTGRRLNRRATEFSHPFADKETLLVRYVT